MEKYIPKQVKTVLREYPKLTYDQAKQLYDIAMSGMVLPIEWVKTTCSILHRWNYNDFVDKITTKWSL